MGEHGDRKGSPLRYTLHPPRHTSRSGSGSAPAMQKKDGHLEKKRATRTTRVQHEDEVLVARLQQGLVHSLQKVGITQTRVVVLFFLLSAPSMSCNSARMTSHDTSVLFLRVFRLIQFLAEVLYVLYISIAVLLKCFQVCICSALRMRGL